MAVGTAMLVSVPVKHRFARWRAVATVHVAIRTATTSAPPTSSRTGIEILRHELSRGTTDAGEEHRPVRAQLLGEEVERRERTIVFDICLPNGGEGRVERRTRYAVGVREQAASNAF